MNHSPETDRDGTCKANYEVFRECMSSAIVEKSEVKQKKTKQKKKPAKRRAQKAAAAAARRKKKNNNNNNNVVDNDNDDGNSVAAVLEENSEGDSSERTDPEELAEFIDFIASETFTSLPIPLQILTYSTLQHSPSLQSTYSTPLPPSTVETLISPVPLSIADSLSVYTIIPSPSDLAQFLNKVLNEYIDTVASPPPVWATTRTQVEACEICERDWIPLTYHHLIPKETHAKVLKKGWHDEWMLNSVAWLCRACHSFVHRMASNEELAREWYTVDRILGRDDVLQWAKWVGRVRWKAR